jgi:hypothetical protein
MIRRYNNQQANNHKVACSLQSSTRLHGMPEINHDAICPSGVTTAIGVISECEHDIGGGDTALPGWGQYVI